MLDSLNCTHAIEPWSVVHLHDENVFTQEPALFTGEM